MNSKYKIKITISVLTAMLILVPAAIAENIDPGDNGSQYSWGENVGWVNFEPGLGDGVTVSSTSVAGYVWAENIGWINLSPSTFGGIINDGYGNLSGYAWGENVGWINFAPVVPGDATDYGVKIGSDGDFYGYAWGENIGWINFSLVNNYVVACKVQFEDLVNFVGQWLESGSGYSGDLFADNKVDIQDFSIFAGYWLDYCPNGWTLK